MKTLILFALAGLFSLSLFASETVKGMQKDYAAFKQDMTAKINSLDKDIQALKEKAKHKGSKAQDATIKSLEESKAELQAKLDQAEAESKSGWRKFKANFAQSIDNLNTRIQKALKDE